jgi:uncharacterized membrane protein
VTAVLLSVHVVAAIVLIGPMTAAASLFPRYARAALGELTERSGPADVARALHRISRGYAVPALVVPVFGLATAARMRVLDEAWLWTSIALTLAAAVLLTRVIVPGQGHVLAELDGDGATAERSGANALLPRLGATTGLFALTWTAVVVLMIVRPGSTTGVWS